MTYGAVIFDLYNTLVPDMSPADYRAALREMGEAVGLDAEDFRRGWEITADRRYTGEHATPADTVREICRVRGLDPAEDAIAKAAAVREAARRKYFTPRPDAVPTLTELRRRGLRLGLISDCSTETVPLWRACPLVPLMDAAILSCEVGCRKPAPRIYQLACDALKVRPEDCIYVGDGASRELTGAARAGMTALQLRLHDGLEAMRQQWSGPSVASLWDVVRFVERSAVPQPTGP
ncbi:MAG: HAD family hydrolase [Chloroflexota bacterium]|nr:HAD family hydrolase [Chloroflexota bacterium]